MLRIVILFSLLLVSCSSPKYDQIWALNKRLSHDFLYVSDEVKHGVVEKWETGVTGDSRFSGDCEEYAFAMQYQLKKLGIESRVWHVVAEGQGHAVTCTVDGLCLDYGRNPVYRENTGYIFLRIIK